MHKIMIVDDEPDLVNGLALSFQKEGYKVITAHDGRTALELAQKENPHLILLDVNMPGINGLSVCQTLRAREIDTRIVMLSAKTTEVDKVVGLEIGADDYITKPFSLRELHSLVRARLRYRDQAASETVTHFSFGDITLDFEKQQATKQKNSLELTSREFEILQFMIKYRGQIIPRERMLDKIWGPNVCATPRTVDNHILRIRKKIEPEPSKPRYLLSAYGGGYRFVG
jgi:two-component system alkaline phosphatase synthesis response regulator PhoP